MSASHVCPTNQTAAFLNRIVNLSALNRNAGQECEKAIIDQLLLKQIITQILHLAF